MSAAKPFPRSVASYIELFDEVMLWSQMNVPTGDWNKLWRRLDALSQRVRDEAADRASAPGWAYRLEHEVLIEVLGETLVPAVLEDLVEALRSRRDRGESDPGVWAALDRKPFEEARDRIRRRAFSAEAGVFAALKQHSMKPSQLRLLEGLRALEALHDARVALAPVFDVEVLRGEGRHLAEALCSLMPPTATRLISSAVEIEFRSELEGAPINELGPAGPFWHHKLPGLGIWYPVWQELRYGADRPDLFGTWFVPSRQTIYEERHGRAEAERASKRNEQRQLRAAEVKRERQIREDADERAKEARLREEHERRRQAEVEAAQEREREEHERRRQAEVEAAQEREREEHDRRRQAEVEAAQEREREEHERHRRADLERQHAERAQQKERSRQSAATPPKPLLERRPEEIQARWAEAEWRRWCKSRGVSPGEVPEDVRERFMRHI